VHGTRRTSSPVDGVADRGAKAGRDGRACEKREEGRSVASQGGGGGEKGEKNGGGSCRGGATRRGHAWGLASTGGRRPDRP
jgi:hypothetical protein